jgi:hypothetical protein
VGQRSLPEKSKTEELHNGGFFLFEVSSFVFVACYEIRTANAGVHASIIGN